jgi:hypothetical protein
MIKKQIMYLWLNTMLLLAALVSLTDADNLARAWLVVKRKGTKIPTIFFASHSSERFFKSLDPDPTRWPVRASSSREAENYPRGLGRLAASGP